MAFKLTTVSSTPYLLICDMRIHPSFFIQGQGSNKAYYWMSTLKKLNKSEKITHLCRFRKHFIPPCDKI